MSPPPRPRSPFGPCDVATSTQAGASRGPCAPESVVSVDEVRHARRQARFLPPPPPPPPLPPLPHAPATCQFDRGDRQRKAAVVCSLHGCECGRGGRRRDETRRGYFRVDRVVEEKYEEVGGGVKGGEGGRRSGTTTDELCRPPRSPYPLAQRYEEVYHSLGIDTISISGKGEVAWGAGYRVHTTCCLALLTRLPGTPTTIKRSSRMFCAPRTVWQLWTPCWTRCVMTSNY